MRRQNALINRATGITVWQREVTNNVFLNSLSTLVEEDNFQYYTNIQLSITDIFSKRNHNKNEND